MTRRNIPIATHPEVEHSQAELEILEGKKTTAQEEVLRIAENKKKVEESRKVSLAQLDKEIEDKRAELKKLSTTRQGSLSAHEKEKARTESAADLSRKEVTALEAKITELTGTIAGLKKDIAENETRVQSLSSKEEELTTSISSLTRTVEELQTKSATLETTRSTLEDSVEKAKKAHADELSTHQTAKIEHTALEATVERLKKEIKEAEADLLVKNTAITDVGHRLNEAEKKAYEVETATTTQDNDSNLRLKNATNLEQKINEKLEHLKEVEKHFTTEHLARMGYKPIGT